ncbi:hypothetical protein G7Y89_g10450 [Cudoniella acicularis]|uniref:Neutral protease 2 n=1 Tax=Cudoniella acicularis TaxID=354080 RepID=A0A8H4REB0_9HELO|nr:hypothetical protein G7Y89_g10450 [Cudoniella acicularis]
MHFTSKYLTAATILTAASAATIENGKRATGLEVTLTTTENSVIEVIPTVKNIGTESLSVLTLDTPMAFMGVYRTVKYTSLSVDSFQLIEAGATFTTTINAASVHDFKIGTYTVIAEGAMHFPIGNSTELPGSAVSFKSNALSIAINETAAAAVPNAIPAISITERTVLQSGCSTANKAATTKALSNCASLANAAATAATSGSSAKFNKYFKSTSISVRSTVAARTKYYCTDVYGYCDSNALAYTIPSTDEIVNCPIYYTELTSLTTSCHTQDQTTTTLHEMTRAPAVYSPGTDDNAYGYSAGTKITSAKAILNADTYALYANAASASEDQHAIDKIRATEGERDSKEERSLEIDGDDTAAIPKGTIDPVYEAKARVLNNAIQEIGMGSYQWQLFVVVGFGWANDNLWPIVTSLISEVTPITNEFLPSRPPLLSLAQNIGLLAGAMFWGFGCDVFGRRWAFNLTLGVTAVFGLAAAGSPNFAAIGCFAALWSFGVGGNLPVDSAVFLEFLPGSHQYLLTILSIDWAIAQVIANLIAWPLLGNLTCQEDVTCTRSANMGWRYFVIAMGGISMIEFFIRFVFFTIHESPKYLMGKGRDEEAVRVVHDVARRNGKTSNLTIDDLKACEIPGDSLSTDATAALKRKLEKLNLTHVRALFANKKLALSTTLIMVIWAFIGLGYPLYNAFLPYIQATRGAKFGDGSTYLTYRNSLIIAVLGIPGALLGGVLVEIPKFGRKGTLAISTAATGAFLIFGIMAPIIAMFANLQTAAPVYTSGALFIVAGLLVVVLPFEPQGKASL